MASGDLIVRVADKTTLDNCYAVLQELEELYDTGLKGENLEMSDASEIDVLEGKTFYSGNNILKTGTIPVKSSATYGASTKDQTISGEQYLAGDQTIAAVTQSGLVAENIAKGTTISVESNGNKLWNVAGVYSASDVVAPFGVVCANLNISLGQSNYGSSWNFSGGVINSEYITCSDTTYTVKKSGRYSISKWIGYGSNFFNPVWTVGLTDGYIEAGTTFSVGLTLSKGTDSDSGLATILVTYLGDS